MKRESSGSRLSFILVSAGCVTGIGNVWKFPYVTGASGGGLFVLFYLLFLVIMGIPVFTIEFSVGRAGRKSTVGAYKALEPKGSFWHLHGWVCLIDYVPPMMYYTTVSGWMVSYSVKFLRGDFMKVNGEAVDQVFTNMLGNPGETGFYMALTMVLGFLICPFGPQKGLERITKITMVGLLGLILLLGVHSLVFPGAMEGVRFYLFPDLGRAMDQGFGEVITTAMNQSLFTLSLDVGAMEVFGSYMDREKTLVSEVAWICVLDTLVALLNGLITFPACFSYGVRPNAGPSLIFITLPRVFLHMSLGRLWGALFFLFMTFASFSTVIAVFENLMANLMDSLHWSRKKVALVCYSFILIASVPCMFGYNVWSNLYLIGGKDVLDNEDFIVSNLLLPLGFLILLLFCTTRRGWGLDHYPAEANDGKGIKLPRALKYYFQSGLLILVLIILF